MVDVKREYSMTLKGFVEKYNEGDIDLNAPYQRDYVWKKGQAEEWIEYVLNRKMLIFPITLVLIDPNSDRYEVFDGKQRMTSLIQFFNNETKRKDGGFYKDLPKEEQKRFGNKTIRITELIFENNDEKEEEFKCINTKGTKVVFSDLFYSKAKKDIKWVHIWNKKDFKVPSGLSKYDRIKFLTEIVLKGHSPLLAGNSMFRAYNENDNELYDNIKEKDIKKIVSNADFIVKSFQMDSPGSVFHNLAKKYKKDFLWVIAYLSKNSSQGIVETRRDELRQSIFNFFIDIKKEIPKNYTTKTYERILTFFKHFCIEEVYQGSRCFSDVQKLNKMLQENKRHNQYHADHKIPFSKGGFTDEDNIQLLTPEENLKKSDKIHE